MKNLEKVLEENKFDENMLHERYRRRLEKTYVKEGVRKSFINQLGSGKGKELVSKFWSPKSSSRLAFELYSWIAGSDECKDIELEFRLPGIKSGKSESSAYMDVFIKTGNEIWFIESKFTESVENYKSTLPQAYYKMLTDNGREDPEMGFSKETYYYTSTRKKNLTRKSVKERFRGHDKVAEYFIPFVNCMMDSNLKKHKKEWFDAKQETCHLFGIIMYILENISNLRKENIATVHLQNIFYCQNESFSGQSCFTENFVGQAKVMVHNILKEYGITDIRFEFGTSTVQEMVEKYGDMVAYENDGKTMRKSIVENFPGISFS